MSSLVLENPRVRRWHVPEEIFSDADYHRPVLPQEVLAFLRPHPGMIFLDGTIGGGGHTELLLDAGATVIGIDQDAEAVEHCRERLARYGSNLRIFQRNFDEASDVLDEAGVRDLSGAVLDLGVSSHQLDTAGRGFSFRNDGPLDMRMSRDSPRTAAELVNEAPLRELARILLDYGEEPRAFQIASRIVRQRAVGRIQTTRDLVEVIEPVLPSYSIRHPATKVFQALRIAVNDELGALERGLQVVTDRLAKGGRFAVITFHSLEDRIVKRFFRDRSKEWIDRPEWPAPRRNPEHKFHLLTPRPIEATAEEVDQNPRSRSAKLRVAERR